MTKFIKRRVLNSKPVLSSIVLPGVDILPVLPTLSIAHVQSTTVPSQTQLIPSPVHADQTHHNASPSLLEEKQADTVQDQEKPGAQPDIVTRSEFFEMMDNLKWDIFKPP